MRNSIVLALLFPALALADVIRYVQTGPGFRPQAEITLAKRMTLTRNTNFLDQEDLSLGSYFSTESTEDAPKKLLKVMNHVREADKLLKKSKTSFNDLNSPQLHGPRYEIENLRVLPGSSAFANVDAAFKEVLGMKWTLKDGVKLDTAKNLIQYVKAGKVVRELRFSRDASCTQEGQYAKCRIPEWGVLSIKFSLEK